VAQYVQHIKAVGVYGRYDFQMSFGPVINIVHGTNGSGKTILVHILANILNGEYYRFVFLPFKSITVKLDDGTRVRVFKQSDDNEPHLVAKQNHSVLLRLPIEGTRTLLSSGRIVRRDASATERRRAYLRALRSADSSEREHVLRELQRLEGFAPSEEIAPPLPAAYFPAFRTMIDAWASVPDDEPAKPSAWSRRATRNARRLFGEFIPPINYPSLLEIEGRLGQEVQDARMTIAQADRKFLSQAFLDIFESLSGEPQKDLGSARSILGHIRSLFNELEDSPLQEESTLVTRVYAKLSESIEDLQLGQESEGTAVRVLNVYRELLQKVIEVQQDSFKAIEQYLESVNQFLQGKKIVVDPSVPRYRHRSVGIQFSQGDRINRLRALSSGERQIATLIYAATHMSKQKVLLIDEPEISLHVDWQRRLIGEMSEQVGDRQIIACTHSPSIGADYEEFQKEIRLTPTVEGADVLAEMESDEIEEIPF
jgi:predicted ATPase